ncbi:hypothetical protein OG292_10290 [Streptomyces sp. NBC_01511]
MTAVGVEDVEEGPAAEYHEFRQRSRALCGGDGLGTHDAHPRAESGLLPQRVQFPLEIGRQRLFDHAHAVKGVSLAFVLTGGGGECVAAFPHEPQRLLPLTPPKRVAARAALLLEMLSPLQLPGGRVAE